MIPRLVQILLLCFCTFFVIKAQDKPISKYSKKELLVLVTEQSNQLNIKKQSIVELKDSLSEMTKREAADRSKIEMYSKQLKEEVRVKKELTIKLEELSKTHEDLKAAPPKNIEVLDLYSFGYQPYNYNERQYQQHLKVTREEIIKVRLANVRDLVRLLQSTKIGEDVKKTLYLGFNLSYKGYLGNMTQERLTYYNESIEAEIKKRITQKTYKELDIISKENRWIQILEQF